MGRWRRKKLREDIYDFLYPWWPLIFRWLTTTTYAFPIDRPTFLGLCSLSFGGSRKALFIQPMLIAN
jgi:hypothetical protein